MRTIKFSSFLFGPYTRPLIKTTSSLAVIHTRFIDAWRLSSVCCKCYNLSLLHAWRSSHLSQSIGRKLRFLSHLGGPRRNIAITYGMEKLEQCGYPRVKKYEDMSTRFHRIDERTDGQTTRDGIGRYDPYSIARQNCGHSLCWISGANFRIVSVTLVEDYRKPMLRGYDEHAQ